MFRRLLVAAIVPLVVGCESRAKLAAADSIAAEQTRLAMQLSAQKDSLTRVVVDADAFIAQIDSQVSRVKGLPKAKQPEHGLEGPLEEQLHARADMLVRVKGLVDRAQRTATELAEARRRERSLRGQLDSLREHDEGDHRLIADLGATIDRQRETIAVLTLRVDSLSTENTRLGHALVASERTRTAAYYIIGTERELIDKGVIVKEGGANLLLARVGRTLQPARTLDVSLFTAIDRRQIRHIEVPDSTRRYAIISRQDIEAAEVSEREKSSFRGNLHIADIERFWGPSPYLILVQR
ncbi:MAG TPA: hypothetical protein VK922_15030 [Gemmatimonadaceae bacterium]|nr:hypothetical protein [Gemmatimonadaceae bacterium]